MVACICRGTCSAAISGVARDLKLAGTIWAFDCFNRVFKCSIRVFRFFKFSMVGHNQHLGGPRPCLTRPWIRPWRLLIAARSYALNFHIHVLEHARRSLACYIAIATCVKAQVPGDLIMIQTGKSCIALLPTMQAILC